MKHGIMHEWGGAAVVATQNDYPSMDAFALAAKDYKDAGYTDISALKAKITAIYVRFCICADPEAEGLAVHWHVVEGAGRGHTKAWRLE